MEEILNAWVLKCKFNREGREEVMNRDKIYREGMHWAPMGTCALWHHRTRKGFLRKKMVLFAWEEGFQP